MSATEHKPLTGVSKVAWDILASGPKRRLMRDRVGIGQRWRRRSTGEVVVIAQVHRSDRQVEVVHERPRQSIGFDQLRDRYEQIEEGR